MNTLFEKVKKYNKIYILGHVKPDGDCYGSSLGLKEIIKENFQKEAIVLNQKSEALAFLGECHDPSDIDFEGSLAIQVDTANKERSCNSAFMKADYVIKIDHHVVVDSYGDFNIERQISSCAELIATLAVENDLVINKEAAKCLYTGIFTDTGRFFFPGVNGNTHRMVAKLLDTGFDMNELHAQLSYRDFDILAYQAYVYANIKSTAKGVLYLYVDRKNIERLGLSNEQVGGAISEMSMIRNHPIWVLFYEMEDVIRVRLRSDRIKLNQVAEMFNGGGHFYASGATLYAKKDVEKVLAKLDELL